MKKREDCCAAAASGFSSPLGGMVWGRLRDRYQILSRPTSATLRNRHLVAMGYPLRSLHGGGGRGWAAMLGYRGVCVAGSAWACGHQMAGRDDTPSGGGVSGILVMCMGQHDGDAPLADAIHRDLLSAQSSNLAAPTLQAWPPHHGMDQAKWINSDGPARRAVEVVPCVIAYGEGRLRPGSRGRRSLHHRARWWSRASGCGRPPCSPWWGFA